MGSKYSWNPPQRPPWGTEESGRCREGAAVEKSKQESTYGLSAQKSDRSREVAVSIGSTVTKHNSPQHILLKVIEPINL